MNFVILGCGLIGVKRAHALKSHRLVACVDTDLKRAEALARAFPGARGLSDPLEAVSLPEVDAVIVAVPHISLPVLTEHALRHGKHVLVEKPAARSASELAHLPALADKADLRVRVGFNHRYHRALRRAREIVDQGLLGDLMFVRARYGHGGRLGYNKEWRAVPELSGGGELIDQGMHLIDLARWFLGDFPTVEGFASTCYWDMLVDDNAFLLMRTREKRVAFLHASASEWKNLFSFEIYGKDGKLHIEGLGGSYGVERLSWYKMLPQMGPPETTIFEYPMADDSWEVEIAEFVRDVELNRTPDPGLTDAIAALEIVGRIYANSDHDHRS